MYLLNTTAKKIAAGLIFLIIATILMILMLFGNTALSSRIKELGIATNDFLVQALHSDVLNPPPLLGNSQSSDATLTQQGVFEDTNKERIANAVAPLTMDATLNQIAQTKLNDMFKQQYFEHTSPQGVGASDLAKNAGYDYIVIGENLAMGNFKDDQALLDAWMASPGHRANILNIRYQQIGIAVGEGEFGGKKTWIAVQEFGLPITACPQPSTLLKYQIDTERTQVSDLNTSLANQKAAIDATNPQYGPDYNAKVQAYNTSVKQYNALVTDLKSKINTYNLEVRTFNGCAQASTTEVGG